MSKFCDVAIVGAGPYGLSLAAHLAEAGVNFRIFGKPLATWRTHMPKDMHLKSEGVASNLSAPSADSTLKAYCKAQGIAYADQNWPVPLPVFCAYAEWFRQKFVQNLVEQHVTMLERVGDIYALTLEDGTRLCAGKVVLAVGITWFRHIPDELSGLDCVSHSYDHRDADAFSGRDVVVLGAGASAIDTAALFHDAGAKTTILTRRNAIPFHEAPDPDSVSWLKQVTHPASGIGPGWKSVLFAGAPHLFRHLPTQLRLDITKRYLGPAPGWFMRDRIEGRVPVLMGHALERARWDGDKVELALRDSQGSEKSLQADHVVAATGFRPDLRKLSFLAPLLRDKISAVAHTPILSGNFETSVPGLYAIGVLAANSFGPLLRFMVGAEFAAPRLAAYLKRWRGARKAAA